MRLISWQGETMGEKLTGLVGDWPLDGKRLDDDMGKSGLADTHAITHARFHARFHLCTYHQIMMR